MSSNAQHEIATTVTCPTCKETLRTFARNRAALAIELSAANWHVGRATAPDGKTVVTRLRCGRCHGGPG